MDLLTILVEFQTEIAAAIAIITAIGTYIAGRKSSNANTYKEIMDTYNFALTSLRSEFQAKFDRQEATIQYLRKRLDESYCSNCLKKIKGNDYDRK